MAHARASCGMGSLFPGKEGSRRKALAPALTSARSIPLTSQYPHFLDDTKLLKRYRGSTHHGSFPPQVSACSLQPKCLGAAPVCVPGRAAMLPVSCSSCLLKVSWQGREGIGNSEMGTLQVGAWKKDKVVTLLGDEHGHLLDEEAGPSPVEEYEPDQPTFTGQCAKHAGVCTGRMHVKVGLGTVGCWLAVVILEGSRMLLRPDMDV